MKILIAVDHSPHSARAVEFVRGMRWPGGSSVLVASVVPPVPWGGREPAEPSTASPDTEPRPARVRLLTHARDALREVGLSTESRIGHGDPGERLVQLVEQERVDLLVVGSRGRTRLVRRMLGSVSDHAVNHAPCSVLVVKSPPVRRRGPTRSAR